MSGGMPELGSKISLISKADIRYEGRLFTVDPAECTIALSSVRSFGTEDRETQYQIAPQSQIYDYILFRGSDIKDIRVVNNSLPTDPAIMQVQLPNGQHVMPHFPIPNMNTTHPPPMGSTTYPFGNIGGIGNIGNNNQNATQPLAPGSGAPGPYMLGNQQQQTQQQQQKPQTSQQQQPQTQQTQQKQPSELNHPITLLNNQQQQQQAQSQSQSQQSVQQNTSASIIPPKQTQATPAESKKKSQQLNQSLSGTGVGVGGSGSRTNDIGVVGLISGIGGGTHSSSNTSMVYNSNAAPNDNKNQVSVLDMLTGASRSTTPISLVSRKSPLFDMGMQGNQQQQPHLRPNQYNQHQNQNNAVHGGNSRDAGHKRLNPQQRQRGRNGESNHDYYHQQHDRRDSGRNMDNYNQHHDGRNNYNNQRSYQGNQGRMWNMHRGSNNANMMRNRGGGGRGRMPNQGFRPMGGPGGIQNKPRNNKTIKFEQDFDFEQANNKFEELCSQLSKFKVGEEPKTEQINGETDKKDDSGNETGAGEHEPEEEEVTVGYDKTKSFFDNISCEAQDRAKNKKNDWRQERKLNSETFGAASTRRGSYRGRPNYYNRNYSAGGAYNRGYRGGNNNYRNRSNNRMGGLNEMGNVNGNNASTTNAVANLKNQQPSTPGAVGSAANASSAPSSATKKTAPQETNTPTHMTPVIAGQ